MLALLAGAAPAVVAAGASGSSSGNAPGAAGSSASTPFAALTVTPKGAQTYDISTGVTTLPDGGTIVDQDTGVRLQAAHITYVDGAYIDAKTVTVHGDFGTLAADTLHIDIKTGVLTASGKLSLTRGALTLKAAKIRYDANRRVADFSGPVSGTSPDFKADRLLLDADNGDVLLLGDYRYSNGPFTLQSPKGGGRLELVLHQVNGSPVYDAATDVSPKLLARFAAELH